MRSRLSALLVAAASVAGAAQIELRFESVAEREVWVLDQMPERMPAAGRVFKAKSIPVDVDGDSQVIVVHDEATSSVAVKRAGDIEGAWTITNKDWKAAEVVVKAFANGDPLLSGRIELHGPNFSKSMPVEDGQSTFFAVAYGEVEVKVDSKGGGIPPAAPQIFRITKDSKPEERTIAVTVVADPSAEAGPKETTTDAPSQAAAPWYVNLLLWLVGLALAAAGLFLLMRFLKDRSDVVEEKLRGLGVPVPSDLGSPPADDAAPTAEPFEPTRVVAVGHCAYCGKPQAECICRLDAPRAVPTSREPELIGAGVELRIPEGESVVGREGDLQIVDPTVSRRHAKIIRDGSAFTIEDLGSANGTYVDGVRIEAETALTPGSTVYFGSVKVRLEA